MNRKPRTPLFEPWSVTGLLLIAVSIYVFRVHGEYDFAALLVERFTASTWLRDRAENNQSFYG